MQYIGTATEFELTHFNSATVTVNTSGLNFQALLGMSLTNEQIKKIAGAPSGSTITPYRLGQAVTKGTEDIPPGVYFKVENANYIRSANKIGIYRASDVNYGIYINSVDFKSGGPKGMAARMLAVVIRQALAIGNINVLRLYAAGGRSWPPLNPNTKERWGGYYAWPLYGFDMELPRHTLELAKEFPHYPEEIRTRRKVSEVLKCQGGKEYWRIVGDGDYMEFDLSSGSTPSVAILDTFLKEKQI
jgi:hypothetical protein